MKPAAEVVAGAERTPGAAEHDHLDLGVERGLAHRGLELVGHRRDDRVQPLGAVQRDRCDRAVGSYSRVSKAHGAYSLSLVASDYSRSWSWALCPSVAAAPSHGHRRSPRAGNLARWTPYVHLSSPIDVVGPRPDGEMVVAANGRLWLLSRAGDVREFASTYHSNPGLEAYVALASPAHPVAATARARCTRSASASPEASCRCPRRSGAAVRLDRRAGADRRDRVRRDGPFGSRLLVVTTHGRRSTVDAIGCHGGGQAGDRETRIGSRAGSPWRR